MIQVVRGIKWLPILKVFDNFVEKNRIMSTLQNATSQVNMKQSLNAYISHFYIVIGASVKHYYTSYQSGKVSQKWFRLLPTIRDGQTYVRSNII